MTQLPPIFYVRPVIAIAERLVDLGHLRTSAYDVLEVIDIVRHEYETQGSDVVAVAAMLAELVLLDIDTFGTPLDRLDRQTLTIVSGHSQEHADAAQSLKTDSLNLSQ